MLAAASGAPSAFWFLTRGTGAVTLVLLTLTVALGILNARRTHVGQLPRFVLDGVHRTASVLAVSFLLVHITTALLDGFAPITLLDVVIPFGSAYRPPWIGFGAVAFDLILAILVTSLVRRRLGYGAWRATHWLAYASWPVALLHSLGTGSDTKTHWMLTLTAACVAVMVAAVLTRILSGWPSRLDIRIPALTLVILIGVGLSRWLPSGPLAPGWARRAGTPAFLLATSQSASVTGTAQSVSLRRSTASAAPMSEAAEHEHSFRSLATGTLRQSQLGGGRKLVDIALDVPGQRLDHLRIRIAGQALSGGGVSLGSSRVTLGPSANPGQYSGRVTALQGSEVAAQVSSPGYGAYGLRALLSLSPSAGTAQGTLSASAQEGKH